MMKQYFDGMVSAFEAKFRKQPSARRKFTLEILRLGQRLSSGTHHLAWCGVCTPFDLLSAMGVTSCFVEFVGGMLASTGNAGPFLEASEHAGFLSDGCGWQRTVIGATVNGVMPKPDLAIATNNPCSSGLATVEHLARTFDCPLFVLNIPSDHSEENIRFLARQIKAMVDFVTEHTGQTLDTARLHHAMEKTNEARAVAVEALDLARRVPSPVNGTDLKNFGILLPLFLGTQAGVDIARAYRDEFAQRCEQEESGVPDERFRLMWLQESIQFKHPLIRMLEDEYHAAIVVDELNNIYWEPIDVEDPYIGLARRTIAFPFNGTLDHRLKQITRLAEAYQVDGAINPCHWGCRQGTGSRGLVEAHMRKLEIPVVNLEVDCADSRNFSEGQLRTRLEAFMELLESRNGLRS
jgi:benzoyl-CoA reductase/2-hydroxyglutaryl-CoA dehydratase subunit BcrC/BadD/HgdB